MPLSWRCTVTHDHGHSHADATTNRTRLIIALAVTGTILIAEVVGAIITNSLALLVDAAHMLTDTLGLLTALVAATLMMRPPNPRRTWGWLRIEVIAAAAQAGILLAVGAYAIVEGIQRLISPPEVMSTGLLVVGAVGLIGNVISLLALQGGRDANLNMRAAFLEVSADALGSIAVLVAAGIIATTGWHRADAIASLTVAALIVPRAISLLRESGSILLESTPEGLDLERVRAHLLSLPHVMDVHDLHASAVGSGLPVVTAHVVLHDDCFRDGHSLETLEQMLTCLRSHHEISVSHSTFQLESSEVASTHVLQLHS